MTLKHRDVVSNFFFRKRDSCFEVALFERSEQVRTYAGKFSPVSGTVEAGERPHEAALREIEEETGLNHHSDFELHLSGKPFKIRDESIGRSWTIHPFSWLLTKASADFRLDWEHTSYRWVLPQTVISNEMQDICVPRLSESLKRVWLQDGALFDSISDPSGTACQSLEDALSDLKNDHVSGAGYMSSLAVSSFLRIVSLLQFDVTTQKHTAQLRKIAWHIINNGRPSMNAAISRTLLTVLKRIERCTTKAEILDTTQQCLSAMAKKAQKISSSFVGFVKEHFKKRRLNSADHNPARISILTLSSSITKNAIGAALRDIPDVEIDLRILESRPLCEGVQMASKLLQSVSQAEEARLTITIATDASAAILAKDIDLVLLGADRIASTGDVSNKTGSLAAVLCARAVGAKCADADTPKIVILSGSEKIAKPGKLDEHPEEDNCSTQLSRVWHLAGCKQEAVATMSTHKRVFFKNVFFEWVDAAYIDLYLTEEGAMSPSQISVESQRAHELEEEIFQDLW